MPEAKIFLRLEDLTGEGLKSAESKLTSLGKSATNVGKKMSLFVTGPIVAMGGLALKAASDAEEMGSKFEVVFGKLADETKKWSEDFGDSIGRSTASVQGWMASLQDTFVPLGFARDEGAKMSKTLAQLTVDMASFNNESEANVIRDLQSALVGNHETVRKYGVIITQATLEQELLNMGIEGGIRAATEQEKVMARMNIILEGTTDAQGDAARTADSFANRMRALKESSKDLLINIGDKLIPIVSKLIEVVNKAVDWFNNLSDRQQKIIITVAGVVAAIGPLLLIGGQLLIGLQALIPVIIAVNAALAANPIGLVVIAVAALAAGAVLLIKNWDSVKEFFIGIWGKLKELIDKVPDWVLIMMPFVGLPLLIIRNWEGIKEFIKGIMDAIKYHFVDRFVEIIEKIKGGVEKVTGFFKNMFEKIVGQSYVPEMVDRIDEEFGRLKDVMKSNAEEATSKTQGIFGDLADYMENQFEPHFASTMESVWTSTMSFGEKIKETVKQMISDILRGLATKQAALGASLLFFAPLQALKHIAAAALLFSAAGAVMQLQQGGMIPGYGGGDTVPAMLEPGEMVIRKEAVRENRPMLENLNAGGGGGDINVTVPVYLDGKQIQEFFIKSIRSKQIPIYQGAIVKNR